MTTPIESLKLDGMSMDEFLERSRSRPIKIIDGEIIDKPLTILLHSLVIENAREIFSTQAKSHHPGRVFVETTYILPTADRKLWVKGSRVPDVMFYRRERFNQYIKSNPDWKTYPFALIPDLVVEVLSPNDRYIDVMRDVNAYLRDGVRLILVLEPADSTVVIHAPGKSQPEFLKAEDTLTIGEVMPDFSIPVKDFFAVPEEAEDESDA